ncbi:hypothetical protein [Lysobacter hankyongensis]|uniref:Uncharacterized protein n=1 Tax=Lysobacter hankyongensis TaxID=1176535 RepID=A0ABP9B158_9GAMM
MSHDIENPPRTPHARQLAEDGAFFVDETFLGVALQAAHAGRGVVRAVLDGVGEVTIDAAESRFSAQLSDWEDFCTAPIGRLRVTHQSVRAPSSEPWRDLSELLWIAGYHASAGRLPADANRHAVIKLAHWPNLSRLPRTPDMYRLCALLARRPSSIHLAGKLLGVNEVQAFRFFSAAHAAGAIEMVTRTHGISSANDDEEPAADALPPSETSLGSMLKQLWNKMTGR